MKTNKYKLIIDFTVDYDESIEEEEIKKHVIDSLHGNTMDRSDIVPRIREYCFLDVIKVPRLDTDEFENIVLTECD